jgi:hypothetical protein
MEELSSVKWLDENNNGTHTAKKQKSQ